MSNLAYTLRYIRFHYTFQFIIIYLALRSPTWFILKIKIGKPELVKPSTYCAFISYIVVKYFVDTSNCLYYISSTMKLIRKQHEFSIYSWFTKFNLQKAIRRTITNQNVHLKDWWCTFLIKNKQMWKCNIKEIEYDTWY